MSKLALTTWIVIPAHNEEKYISTVLNKVKKYTKNIIVVDDGSEDSTALKAREISKHVLHHKVNLGKGAALKTGCEYAFNTMHAKAVIVMDSDDQHDPQELPLLEKALAIHEIAFGVRSFIGMPKTRAFGNSALSLLVQLLFGTYIPDVLSGYKAFTKQVYQVLRWESSAYGVELEIAVRIAKAKQAYTIVPIKTIYHDFDRGMTLLDALVIIGQVISWRVSL